MLYIWWGKIIKQPSIFQTYSLDKTHIGQTSAWKTVIWTQVSLDNCNIGQLLQLPFNLLMVGFGKSIIQSIIWPHIPWKCDYNLFLWKICILSAAAGEACLNILCHIFISVSCNPPHTVVQTCCWCSNRGGLWEKMWRVLRSHLKVHERSCEGFTGVQVLHSWKYKVFREKLQQ